MLKYDYLYIILQVWTLVVALDCLVVCLEIDPSTTKDLPVVAIVPRSWIGQVHISVVKYMPLF